MYIYTYIYIYIMWYIQMDQAAAMAEAFQLASEKAG